MSNSTREIPVVTVVMPMVGSFREGVLADPVRDGAATEEVDVTDWLDVVDEGNREVPVPSLNPEDRELGAIYKEEKITNR